MSKPTPNSTPLPQNSAPSVRSLLGLVAGAVLLGVTLAIVISVVQVLRQIDSRSIYLGLDGLRKPIGLGLSVLAVLVGLVIWRRPTFRTLALGTLGLVALIAGCCSLFRIESYYGNLVPRLTWRWVPPTQEHFSNYQETVPVAVLDPVDAGELTPTGHDHPGFLGHHRNGVIDGVRLDPDWSQRPPLERWRRPVGLGWGGFAVVGQVAVTQEQRGNLETVVAYDLVSGHELWVHSDELRFEDEHGDGPRATPTIADGRVYTMGGAGLLNCLDGTDGKLIWQHATLSNPKKQNLLWGMAGSPLVVDDLVVVSPGGDKGKSLLAFHLADGQLAWSEGDDPAAYASPIRTEFAGQTQYISFNGAGLRGYGLSGEPLWLYEWITQGERQRVNVAQPVVVTPAGSHPEHGYVLVSSGYGMGMALLEVSRDRESWDVREVWTSKSLKSKMSNFVVRDGFIYGFDNGILTCLDLQTGERQWKRGRYGHGQLLLVDDTLLIQTETGEVVLVAADPQAHHELATLPALSDKTWNHAALAGNILVVRNDREAACYELPERN